MRPIERPEQWTEIASLVDQLLDTPPAERAALIDRLSASDPARRSELEALLAECEQDPALLSIPAWEAFDALFEDEPRFPQGLHGRYRLTRELARGGMATVYLARDEKHGRDVAVKVMRPSIAEALGGGTKRFLREIEIAAQLRHPHIVPLYDSGEADGMLYYVMPYEPDSSLRQRLARDGPLPPDEVVLILRDLSDALADAHARGIVHRDIKPDNVLLSGRHAMITDFGIAKAVSEATAVGPTSEPNVPATATATGGTLGTPAYMAPEQIDGGAPIDHRADIYALGALAYELLVGAPPFTGDTRQEILAAQLTKPAPPLLRQRPTVPAPLASLVMRCLDKEPANRWQSAEELLDQLDRLAQLPSDPATVASWRRAVRALVAIVGIAGVSVAAVFAWRRSVSSHADADWRSRWARLHVEKLTDFPGSEVDPAISRDGQLVAFLADRDNGYDAFVTRVRTGAFLNLTGGRFDQLYNEDVRNVGFTPDGADVWIRVAALTAPASVSLVTATGGRSRAFLPTAVMVTWSPDGSRLAYHETTPGDPIFVADADGRHARRIYISPGLHSHFLEWSPDGRFLYFAHGLPPDEMDIWRIPASGGQPQRITSHNSRVQSPVLLDGRTLLYTATDDDGTGPWLYMADVERRVSTRLSLGVEHYLSISASGPAAGRARRLVAAVSNPTVQLWTVPLASGISGEDRANPLALPTARSAAPRYAPDSSALYLASRGGSDGLWRLSKSLDGRPVAREIWRPLAGAVASAASASPDGATICVTVRRQGHAGLRCMRADGSGERTLAPSLDVRGAPSWSPDGKWIAIAARDGPALRVFKVPVAGGPSVRLTDSVSSNPVWSPDGRFILYSGTARGRSVPLRAMRPDGTPFASPLAGLLVDRLGDSYRFMPGGTALVVKLGGFRRQDFWLFDLASGTRRLLTRLRPGRSVGRFDVSRDGRQILFERIEENSDIALLELPER